MFSVTRFVKYPFFVSGLLILQLSQLYSQGDVTDKHLRYFEVKKLEKCLLLFPDSFDADRQYDLIIGLHGNGGNAKNFSRLWTALSELSVIYAVPESPYELTDNPAYFSPRYSWGIPSDNRELWVEADRGISEYICNIARGLKSEYNISGTYLLGFSQGAGFAYAAGISYKDDFDGLICFGGRLPDPEKYPWFLSKADLENNNTLKVFVAHGIYDMAISPDEGRKSYRILKKLGYNSRLRLFDGAHEVPEDILKEAVRWMQKNSAKDL